MDGTQTTLAALLAAEPRRVLGDEHIATHGHDLGFLAKLLDSAMRLHVQAHPTRTFAQTRLASPYGKLEAYVILGVRPGNEGWIRLGFQRSPGREGWRRIVEEQDISAMDACFDRIPVAVGETWLVPGGWPHAIGPGVLMLEVMEPSDLVVRCEFEREGIVVPPAGRFMGRGLDFCLDVFDYSARNIEAVQREGRIAIAPTGPVKEPRLDTLVGQIHTDCFTIRRLRLPNSTTMKVPCHGRVALLLVETGTIDLTDSNTGIRIGRLESALVEAAHGDPTIAAATTAEILIIQPG
jgi:mannose-6-phosphate isomerase